MSIILDTSCNRLLDISENDISIDDKTMASVAEVRKKHVIDS